MRFRVNLARPGQEEPFFGRAEFEQSDGCHRVFHVGIGDEEDGLLVPGVYDLRVGEDVVAEFEVHGEEGGPVEGGVRFSSEPEGEERPLTFDPRGRTLTIEREGDVTLTGDLP